MLEYARPGTDNARAAPLWRRIAAIALLILGFAVYLNEICQSVGAQAGSRTE